MMQSILHVALVVRDYDEAIEFYTKKLNFRLVEDTYEPEQDKRWVGADFARDYVREGAQKRVLRHSCCFQRPVR